MSKKVLGLILVTLGDAVVVVSLAADAIGWGEGSAIGWKQATGTMLGLFIQLAGVWLLLVEPKVESGIVK